MGCGPSENQSPAVGKDNKLRIYGDFFSADTRALIAICQMANIEHNFELIDTLER